MLFEIALTKKRGTSDFVARGQLHCEFTASSGETLQRESRIAGERFQTKVANIKLTPPSQALSPLFFFLCLFLSPFPPLVFPTCLSHLIHNSVWAIFLKYRM